MILQAGRCAYFGSWSCWVCCDFCACLDSSDTSVSGKTWANYLANIFVFCSLVVCHLDTITCDILIIKSFCSSDIVLFSMACVCSRSRMLVNAITLELAVIKSFAASCYGCNKKAQLTLTNPRDSNGCKNFSNSTCFVSFHRWSFFGGLGGTTGSASDSRSEGRGFDSRLRSVFHSCQVNRLG